MKIDYTCKIFFFLFLLILCSSTGLNANSALAESSCPITPPNAIYEKMLKHLVRTDTCQFSDSRAKTFNFKDEAFDPHSMLIFQSEPEAGRVTFYLDAYYGQSLQMEIQNGAGELVADLSREEVRHNYVHVDLAAWDCGTYYILLINDHGEVEQYQFVID